PVSGFSRAIELVDLVGELGDAARRHVDVLDADVFELVLHGRVGRGTDQEGIHVVVPGDARVPEPLDLVQGHVGDAVLVDLQLGAWSVKWMIGVAVSGSSDVRSVSAHGRSGSLSFSPG